MPGLLCRILIVFAMIAASACSSVRNAVSEPVDYESARTLPPLKVPPDLLNAGDDGNPFSGFEPPVDTSPLTPEAEAAPAVAVVRPSPPARVPRAEPLPSEAPAPYARLGRSSDGVAMLAVDDTARQLWQPVADALDTAGWTVVSANAENRTYDVRRGATESDASGAELLRVALLDAGNVTLITVDGDGGEARTAERLLATLHASLSRRASGESQETVAASRPGARAQPAAVIVHEPVSRARLRKSADGVPTLVLDESFEQAWRDVGATLLEIGYSIDSQQQADGVYTVRRSEPEKKPGFFKRLNPWRKKEQVETIQVRLVSAGRVSLVTVADATGTPDRSDAGEQILSMLHDRLK